MQLLLLRYREEIITAKVAKDHIEDSLKSQILFLRDQVVAEQQEKSKIEDNLTQENNSLQERLGKSCLPCNDYLFKKMTIIKYEYKNIKKVLE